jgi:hypothetical protein
MNGCALMQAYPACSSATPLTLGKQKEPISRLSPQEVATGNFLWMPGNKNGTGYFTDAVKIIFFRMVRIIVFVEIWKIGLLLSDFSCMRKGQIIYHQFRIRYEFELVRRCRTFQKFANSHWLDNVTLI